MKTILSEINKHTRDNNIRFYAKGHKYEITTDTTSKYTSVTTWNHQHFPKFNADAVIENIFKSKGWGPSHKYWNMSAEQIKASWKQNGDSVSSAGTDLHEQIELFMNNSQLTPPYSHSDLFQHYYNLSINNSNSFPQSIEWAYFLKFIEDHPLLKPYRTEWMIYDEDLKLAGSIDMVYELPDGTLAIYDWKRAKEISKINNWNQYATNRLICHIPDTNYWHYCLQLNTYKFILERKYNKKVSKLCLVRLHPTSTENSYELIDLPILTTELSLLAEQRLLDIN
jgi:hypothetical protein